MDLGFRAAAIANASDEFCDSIEVVFDIQFGIGVAGDLKGNPGEVQIACAQKQPFEFRTVRELGFHGAVLPLR
jgi:hypothetical protein